MYLFFESVIEFNFSELQKSRDVSIAEGECFLLLN